MYVVLEGIDGCGKDTQADMLVRSYEERGIPFVRFNEPDEDNLIGSLLRHCLKTGSHPEAHAALFLAARMATLPEKVVPALKDGKMVVSCRSFLSTLVYQQEQWPLDWMIGIHEQLQAKPDVIIILDIEPEEAMRRRATRRGEPECYERLDILERVRDRYLMRAEDPALNSLLAPGGRIEVLDAGGTQEQVQAEIRRRLGD